MNLQAFPLYWPEGWKRTPASSRKYARFGKREVRPGSSYPRSTAISINDGVGRILESLEKMGIGRNDIVISTNVRTRPDGLPRSGEKEPDDPGAAVYWREGFNAPMRCMAIDVYESVAGNLGAIAATLEAMRAIERHGGAEILNRTFQGFAALPQTTDRPWWDVLQVQPDASRDAIEANFKRLARERHPDNGGSNDAMAELNLAREKALKEAR